MYELISVARRFQIMLNNQKQSTKIMEIHYGGILLNKRWKMSAHIFKSRRERSMRSTAHIKKSDVIWYLILGLVRSSVGRQGLLVEDTLTIHLFVWRTHRLWLIIMFAFYWRFRRWMIWTSWLATSIILTWLLNAERRSGLDNDPSLDPKGVWSWLLKWHCMVWNWWAQIFVHC